MMHLKKNVIQGNITASFGGMTDREFAIQFAEVSTIADEYTKTYEVFFTMPAPKSFVILPGMTARVKADVLTSSGDGLSRAVNFYLPSNTVLKDAQGNFVYVVEQHDVGVGKIVRKSVVIGGITAQGIEIFTELASALNTELNSALTSGDQVISDGMSKISSGSLVKFITASDLISH